ncbi:hypothetical protein K1719_032202 [Acacia pycnantha]|nr:hypothetical protein K1719_032202 [Acacia pycnantha]
MPSPPLKYNDPQECVLRVFKDPSEKEYVNRFIVYHLLFMRKQNSKIEKGICLPNLAFSIIFIFYPDVVSWIYLS